MLTYEQIADDIRTVLTSETDPTVEAMQELDERYGDAVAEINERLRECGSLLDSGLRTEAIQKCEVEPNLLDLVSIIDFPEFDVWANYSKQFGLPGPPRVLSAIAEQLNDAYNEEASLTDLLRQHRRHALLRSPLPIRLGILRALAHRDSGTPIWQEDVQAYEELRHNQLRDEIRSAYQNKDLQTLADLEQEVRSAAWARKPSQDIVDSAISSHTKIRVRTARRLLESMVDDLTAAYSDFDVEGGRELRSRWNAQAAIAIESDSDPLLELAGPALDWLDEQDRLEEEEAEHRATLIAIEQALDDWVGRQELERLYFKLQHFDREISPTLSTRINERFAALDLTARRRSRLVALGSVAVVILIGGVIAWGIYSYTRASVFENYVAGLQRLVDSGNIQEARSYMEKLKAGEPEVFESAEVQKLAGDVARIEQAEAGRIARLNQLVDSARETGKTWEGHGQAIGLLQNAEEVVQSDFERADVSRARQEINATRQQMQKEYNDAFAAELTGFTRRCDAVDIEDLDALKQLIEEGELLVQRPRVSEVLVAQVQPLVKRLNAQRETELKSRNESELIAGIDAMVGERRGFDRAMNNYIEAFPTKTQAVQCKQVVENEREVFDGVMAWNAFVTDWSDRDYRFLSAQRAGELISEANQMIEKHPGFPSATGVQKILEFLTPMTRRVDDEGRQAQLILNEQLAENIPALGMALVFKDKRHSRYYFNPAKPPMLANRQYKIVYYTDVGFGQTRSERLTEELLRNRRSAEGEIDWIAPQTRYSRAALDRLAEFSEPKWESEFYYLIQALDEYVDMAPQVRVQLLELLLSVGCSGSQPMAIAYQRHLKLIESTPLPPQPTWVDPEDREGVATSGAASRLLSRLGFRTFDNLEPDKPHRAVGRQTATLLNTMQKQQLSGRYSWVGWLRKDERLEWTIVLSERFSAHDAELLVVYPDADSKPVFESVGRIVGGEVSIGQTNPEALVAGRPVYIAEP